MNTTTIRVDRDTHARLLEMSTDAGDSLTETVRQAAEALRRIRFGLRVQEEFTALRNDPEAWAGYHTEAESSHVTDGLD
ncbi:hypothetical protein [Candidatus Poriferisocius sp.]|uniref:hypothetical protein n=1 Tax=Candidatus Poriferisocius sp. TaxID=3101276 RepID=UPI003B02B9DD